MEDFVDEDGGGEGARVGLGQEIVGDVFVVCHRDADGLSVWCRGSGRC